MTTKSVTLNEWALLRILGAFQAPEQARWHLCGYVSGHPKMADGLHVETSSLVDYDLNADAVVTKSGTRYTLGEPAADYEAKYPNAKKRLIDRLASLVEKG